MTSLDTQLVLAIQWLFFAIPAVYGPLGYGIAIFFAKWLILAYIPLVGWFCVLRKKNDFRVAFEAAWSVGVALFLRFLLSALVDRPRPFLAHVDVALLISPPLHTSFPSGHAAAAFAIASALFYANHRIGIVAVLIAIFVAFGRVAVGVHYVTDIIGGAILGAASVALVRRLHRELRQRTS